MPQASSLKADLESKYPGIDVTLIEGSGGVFEVIKDGKLIFSKKALKRFPERQEIFDQI